MDDLSLILRENMVEEGNTGPDTCSHMNNLVNETPERSLCCRDRLAGENFSTLTLDSEWWCRPLIPGFGRQRQVDLHVQGQPG